MPFDGDIRRWQGEGYPEPDPRFFLAIIAALTALSWSILLAIVSVFTLVFFDAASAFRILLLACALCALSAFFARGRLRELWWGMR